MFGISMVDGEKTDDNDEGDDEGGDDEGSYDDAYDDNDVDDAERLPRDVDGDNHVDGGFYHLQLGDYFGRG